MGFLLLLEIIVIIIMGDYHCHIRIMGDFQRGMYVSLRTDQIGGSPVGEEFKYILGDQAKEEQLLQYIKTTSMERLSLYDMQNILPAMNEQLRKFMQNARNNSGIKRIEAIQGWSEPAWNNIFNFQEQLSKEEKFDGFTFEIEWWNQANSDDYGKFDQVLKFINIMRKNNYTDRDGNPISISVYIGYPSQEEMDSLVMAGVNWIYVQYNVKDVHKAVNWHEERLKYILNSNQKFNKTVVCVPIFYGEDDDGMGTQLSEIGLPKAEKIYCDDFDNKGYETLPLIGTQYWEYSNLSKFVTKDQNSLCGLICDVFMFCQV